MTVQERGGLIKDLIQSNGLKMGFIAKSLGIERTSLYRKLTGERSFTIEEAGKLKSLLNLDEENFNKIFFAES